MAKYTIKTGKRGRPATIDTDILTEQVTRYLYYAKKELANVRKSTAGYRDEKLLGSYTSLPNWLETTIDILQRGEKNIELSPASLQYAKKYTTIIKRLGSRRSSTREVALDELYLENYKEELQQAQKNASPKAKKTYQKLEQYVEKMTPKQRAEFFKSNKYESPRALNKQRYEKIRAWAKKQTGNKNMTFAEANAYLLLRRAEDGLAISQRQQAVFGE